MQKAIAIDFDGCLYTDFEVQLIENEGRSK